jgi:hypothetical protein
MNISVAAPKAPLEELHTPQQRIVQAAEKPKKVAFIGLGAMGFGMASWLLKEKFTVCGFDVSLFHELLLVHSFSKSDLPRWVFSQHYL